MSPKDVDDLQPSGNDAQPQPHVDAAAYARLYDTSVKEPESFWAEQAQRITWAKPFTKVKNTSFAPGNIDIRWFEDGTLNVAANCVDRHLETRGDHTEICTLRSARWQTC